MTQIDIPARSAFELKFSANHQLLTVARRCIIEFFGQLLSDEEAVAPLVIVTHELLENAVKFTSRDEPVFRAEVARSANGARVTLETRNFASDAHATALFRGLGEIDAATSTFAHYQALIRKSIKSKTSLGLGIARLRAETSARLSASMSEGRVLVRVEADIQVR
jgi:two-component sensor histidine kinase